ncbi:Sorting nexin-12 [Chelonia mydas]|uniref:Sorting nexin-12 n=3 Tax=Archelosauria TaxID=1329799 RepID=M7BTR2_CHEMY|nr:Sorting nexin-12 [Chelonia mydas]
MPLYTNLPIFKLKESCVRRRYSDFEWLKNELERDSKIVVPPLPGKALKRQLPFRGDEGIFEESFIEERRQGLEQFINKIAGHPLAQNERCLHMFLQEETIDRNYVPGKVRQEQLAEQSSLRDSEADDLERSRSAYRTHELDIVSNESAVSVGSSSFATSTPLMGPAKFHFVTGSPLGDDLEQRDPNPSRRSVPRELTCPRQAGCKSAAPKVTRSPMSKCGNLPEESCGKVTLKPPQRSTALPASSRSCASAEGQAAAKSVPLAFTTPRASRSLALASFESRRASRELLRAGLPPRSRGIALEGKATRLSLGNSRPSMQKAAATGKTSQGSNVETQPAAQLPGSGTVKRSATKLPCSDKCPSSLRPPAKLPGLSSGSRPLLMGSRVSLGPGILCMSKEAGAPGTKLPTHQGTRLRLMKPRPSSVEHTSGTLQPACSLPTGYPGARSSPQDKETENTNSAAAAQALEPSGGEGLSVDTEDKPVGQDLPSAAARDAQCEAYRRTISSLEAQLRAGSLSEGWREKQACALEGE